MFLRASVIFFLINALLLISLTAWADFMVRSNPDSLPSWGVRAQVHAGFFINHRPHLAKLQQRHALGGEIAVLFPRPGKKMWQYSFRHPLTGTSYVFLDTGSPQYLGTAQAIIPFLEFPLYKSGIYYTTMQAGAGLGWMSKKFDPDVNYKNVAIGSHVNCALMLKFNNQFYINPQNYLHLSVGMLHWSNGSFRTPNLGINMGLINLGYSHHFGMMPLKPDTFTRPHMPSWGISMMMAGFPKEIYPAGGRTYIGTAISADVERQWHTRTIYTAGLDYFFDSSLHARISDSLLSRYTFINNSRMGVHVSFVKKMDAFEIWMQMGYYLRNKLPETLNLYHRVGIRQYVGKNIFLCFNLKTHFAKADNAELGFGYRFNNKKIK